eukprot:9472471-Pyramimonas_sp.AAC.3
MRRWFSKSSVRGDAQLTVVYVIVSVLAVLLVMMLWVADHHQVDPHACQSVCEQQLALKDRLHKTENIQQCPKCTSCPHIQCPECSEAQPSSWFSSHEVKEADNTDGALTNQPILSIFPVCFWVHNIWILHGTQLNQICLLRLRLREMESRRIHIRSPRQFSSTRDPLNVALTPPTLEAAIEKYRQKHYEFVKTDLDRGGCSMCSSTEMRFTSLRICGVYYARLENGARDHLSSRRKRWIWQSPPGTCDRLHLGAAR